MGGRFLLPLSLCGCIFAACGVLTIDDLRADVLRFVVLGSLWSVAAIIAATTLRNAERLPRTIFATAVALRLLLLAIPPELSDDCFRYLWEGKIQIEGFSPFVHAPSDPVLRPFRDAVWSEVNHPNVSTIYPPGALLLFRWIAQLAYTPLAWKIAAALADLAVLGLLTTIVAGRRGRAWAPSLYALHPLPVIESAGSGHLESIALLGLLGCILAFDRRRPGLALLAATGGAAVKLLPAVVLPSLLRRPSKRTLIGGIASFVLLLLLAIPWSSDGAALFAGFGRFYESWAFNASLFSVLTFFTESTGQARSIGVVFGASICGLAFVRFADPARFFLVVAACLILLSPVVHPWYVLWVWVPSLVLGAWPWTVLATTCLLAYSVLATYDPSTHTWTEIWWIPWLEYLPLLGALLWWLTRRPTLWHSPALPPRHEVSPSQSRTEHAR